MEPKELQDAIGKGLEPISTEVKATAEAVKATGETVKKLDERVSAIEKLPLDTLKALNINTISKEHRGYRLAKQARAIREMVGKNPGMFEGFTSDEKIDEYCKGVIDLVRKTTMNETTSSQGAYLVPDEFQWDIIKLARNRSFALQFCKVVPMGSDTLYIPAELTHGAVAWKGESVQLAQSDSTFAQVALSAKKLTAYTALTNELLQDSAIDIAGLLTDQLVYATVQELDNQLLNGTGDPVSGLGTAACGYSVVCSAGGSMSTVTASDLSLMISKISDGYLGGSRFLIGRLALHYVRALKDTTNQPIFANPGATVPGTVYEFPYAMTENIANTDGASKLMGVFGNFNYFVIGRRLSAMALESNPYSRFDYYETQFRMVTRWALAYGKSTAFVRLLSAAA